MRANLALGFARGLTNGRVYEESLAALAAVQPEQTVDPAAYFFHRAVAEHALMKKDDAMRTIVRLLDDVAGAPDRYAMLGRIMFVEMATWKKDEKDLSNIRRLMDNSERRLEPGPRREDDPGHPEEDRLPPRRTDQGEGEPGQRGCLKRWCLSVRRSAG